MKLFGCLLALALTGTVSAANTKTSEDVFIWTDPAKVVSYKNVSLDVCDMRNGFAMGKFADVKDVYDNGRYAFRGDGSKRIPKAVMGRIYINEKFYDQMIDYGHPDGAYDLWMSPAVDGVAPYTTRATRIAGGKSWARVYHYVYIAHELDAGLKNAKLGSWAGALEEVEDAYGVFVGTGPCAFKPWAETVSINRSRDITKAFIAAQAAAKKQDVVALEAARDRAMLNLHNLLLKNILLIVDADDDTPFGRATKADAYPFMKSIEAYVADAAPDDVDLVLYLLDYTVPPSPTSERDALRVRSAVKRIAAANGMYV